MSKGRTTFRRTYAVLLGAVAVAGVFAFGAYRPNAARLHATEAAIRDLHDELAVRTQHLERAVELYGAVDMARRQAPAWDEALPDEPRIGALLETIDHLAGDAGLKEAHVLPAKPVRVGKIGILPVAIDFRGSFESIYAFVRQVETLPRIARVERFEIARTDSADMLVATVTVHVYTKVPSGS